MSQDIPFAIGDRVFHEKLGDGSVTGFGGSKGTVTVSFDRSGEKRVVSSFLNLISETPQADTPQADAEPPRASAEVIPFPLRRTPSWRIIADEYARRPDKGRYDKAAYAEKVIANNVDHLQRLGVSPERIGAEVASLQRLFYRADDANEKVRA